MLVNRIFPVQGCNNEFIFRLKPYSSRVHAVGRVKWTLQLASLASSLGCLHATKLPRKLARDGDGHCQEGNE